MPWLVLYGCPGISGIWWFQTTNVRPTTKHLGKYWNFRCWSTRSYLDNLWLWNKFFHKENNKHAVYETELQNSAVLTTANTCAEDRYPFIINRNSNAYPWNCILVTGTVKRPSYLLKVFYLLLWRDRMQVWNRLLSHIRMYVPCTLFHTMRKLVPFSSEVALKFIKFGITYTTLEFEGHQSNW